MRHDFERVFRRLRRARMNYEQLRVENGEYGARAQALSELHAARAEMSALRHLL